VRTTLSLSRKKERHRLHRLLSHRGHTQGLLLTHENYLEQCMAHSSIPSGRRALPQHSPTNHAADFMVGFIGRSRVARPFVHLRTLARNTCEAFRNTRSPTSPCSPGREKLQKGLKARSTPAGVQAKAFEALRTIQSLLDQDRPRLGLAESSAQVHEAFAEARSNYCRRGLPEPETNAISMTSDSAVNAYGLSEAVVCITVTTSTLSRRHRRQAPARYGGCNPILRRRHGEVTSAAKT